MRRPLRAWRPGGLAPPCSLAQDDSRKINFLSHARPQPANLLLRHALAVSFIAFSNVKPGFCHRCKPLIPLHFAFFTAMSTILRFATLDVAGLAPARACRGRSLKSSPLCRPRGTRRDLFSYPGLTSWANLCRPLRGLVCPRPHDRHPLTPLFNKFCKPFVDRKGLTRHIDK